jgi:putative transposase
LDEVMPAEGGFRVPQSYTQLYYHIVWATKERSPLLTPEALRIVTAAVRQKGAEIKAVTHAVNGVEDHLHVAVRLPAALAVAKYVEEVKGYASWLVNHNPGTESRLYWQEGYGALTFRKAELPTVAAYIQRQQEHHRKSTLWEELERWKDPDATRKRTP